MNLTTFKIIFAFVLTFCITYSITYFANSTVSNDSNVSLGLQPGLQHCVWDKENAMDEHMAGLLGKHISYSEQRLIDAIGRYFIDKPRPLLPKFSLPLFYTPQAKAVMAILANKKGGFFVEAGGLDGERSSNTIYLENKYGWNGLLVEMDPSWYMQLRGKNRKAYSINSCLSLNNYPHKMEFKEHSMGEGKLVDQPGTGTQDHLLTTYCFPLYSIMLALNVTKIDYLSLDVEGLELPILKTIPWDKLDISVLSVEFKHGKDGGKPYIDYMAMQGYTMHKHVKAHKPEIYFGCNDYIFVKKGLIGK